MLAQEQAALEALSKLRIVVVGDIMLDHYIWGDATRISPEAPVPVVSVFEDSYTLGGAANVALNLRGLNVATDLCGYVGQDPDGERIQRMLGDYSIGFSPSWAKAGLRTILKTRVIVQKQQLCRIDREDAPAVYAIDPAHLDEALEVITGFADAVVISDYAKGCLCVQTWEKLRQMAAGNNLFLALDPKPRRRLSFSEPDLLTPNRNEAIELAGIEASPHDVFPAEAVCAAIWERYQPKHLVVTLGADGMLLSQEGKVLKSIPTVARDVFDVSGAGDTVIATLTAALSAGAALETAAHLANAAAGVVVAKVGTVAITHRELFEALKDPEHTALSDDA